MSESKSAALYAMIARRDVEITELRATVARLEAAISWAMGEGDSDFGDREEGDKQPRYWWRAELRRRALGEPR